MICVSMAIAEYAHQVDNAFVILVNIFNQRCNDLGLDMLIFFKPSSRAILEKAHRFNPSNLDRGHPGGGVGGSAKSIFYIGRKAFASSV